VSGTGDAGGQSPAGHVRRPSVPAAPPTVGFTCLPSGALLPRRQAVRHCHRTIAYRPGKASDVLTGHYRQAHPGTPGLPSSR
jgi:hypothetical protein